MQLIRHLLLWATFATAACAAPSQPNIIFVLCDDLGFGDTGPTFQQQRAAANDRSVPAFATPQLDQFAAEGVQLRNHYCGAPVCAPSRASLLLGMTQGHANVRDNQFDKALANNHTLASVLKQAGYATAAIGKWGLQGNTGGDTAPKAARGAGKAGRKGKAKDHASGGGEEAGGADLARGNPSVWPAYPTKRGFDFYFGYVRHGDGHFHYPKEDHRQVWENDREVSRDLDGCYTTDLFTARAKKWIVDHQAAHREQPFFLYLAYDTPHAKLQLPPCAYPAGAGLKGGLQWTGKPGAMINTAQGRVDAWYDPAVAKATWDHDKNPATPEVPWPDVQKRYATDVRRIDAAVGDLTQLLRDLGIEQDTLIVFTSDNGPSKESYLPEAYEPDFFDGFGPFDGIKRDVLEGGVREPTLVRWPAHVPGGRVVRTPSGMWDWLATFADLAGVAPPASSDGVSLKPTLLDRGTQRPSTMYVEYFNNAKTPRYDQFAPANRGRTREQMQMVMVDGFTGLRYNVQSATDPFEIYDVEADPHQSHNLARAPAGKVDVAALQQKMQARALQVRRPDPGAPRPYDNAAVPADAPANLVEGRIECALYQGSWPWVPDFRTLTPARDDAVNAVGVEAAGPAVRQGGEDSAADMFGLAFTGYFHAETEGDYTFTVETDGGAELFLHEARVIDDDRARTGRPVSGTIRLAAGWHPIRLYSRHGEGAPKLVATVAAPGGQPLPLTGSMLAVAR